MLGEHALRVGLLLVGAASCARAPRSVVAPPQEARVRIFSESSPVVDLVATGHDLWVATGRGVVHWDTTTHVFERVSRASGLLAQHATALAVDPSGTVWAATESGLYRRLTAAARWEPVPSPDLGDRMGVLAAASEVLYAGGPQGLARLSLSKGRWQRLLRGRAVTAILPEPKGDAAWVGTDTGLVRVERDGEPARDVSSLEPIAGLAIRGLARSGDGGVLALGVAGARSFLGYVEGSRLCWAAVPNREEPRLLRRVRGRTLLGLGTSLYALERVPRDEVPTGALRLYAGPATPGAPAPAKWQGERLPYTLPSGITSTFATANELYIGTQTMGIMGWEGRASASFQAHDLTIEADRLTIACVAADECYVATGGSAAWWFDGRGFTESEVDPEPGSRVLAVLRDPRGHVMAIHRGRGRALRLSRVSQGVWSAVGIQEIDLPTGRPELTFAAFAPTGKLWLGLGFRDVNGEDRFFGAAEIDVAAGGVRYHRQFPRGTVPPPGTMPIPNHTSAIHFATGAIWFATKSGAVRVQLDAAGAPLPGANHVRLYTENDGLESELLRDVTGGDAPSDVLVATDRGVGRFDGSRWTFPHHGPLSARARALARDPQGRLWIATDHGLVDVEPSGGSVVYGRRSGLGDEDVRDVRVDSVGRVWALGRETIAILEPR